VERCSSAGARNKGAGILTRIYLGECLETEWVVLNSMEILRLRASGRERPDVLRSG
jgi:hypothetical protein